MRSFDELLALDTSSVAHDAHISWPLDKPLKVQASSVLDLKSNNRGYFNVLELPARDALGAPAPEYVHAARICGRKPIKLIGGTIHIAAGSALQLEGSIEFKNVIFSGANRIHAHQPIKTYNALIASCNPGVFSEASCADAMSSLLLFERRAVASYAEREPCNVSRCHGWSTRGQRSRL